MKWIIGILGFTAALVGYLKYPSMRYQLTGLSQSVPAKPAAINSSAAPVADTPTPPPATTPSAATPPATTPSATPPSATPPTAPTIDLARLTPAQLPTQVTLKISTEVGDATGLKMKIDPGSRLTLVRIEGDQVVVSPGSSPFEGRVPVSGTDLMDQLAANPQLAPSPQVPAGQAAPQPGTATEPNVTPPQAGTSAVPGVVPPSGIPADAVEVRKSHLRSGVIKEFTFEQVQEWKAEPDEVINAETYQTGLVRYTQENIFGVKTIEAKALMQGGRVVRWIWPKNPSAEIK